MKKKMYSVRDVKVEAYNQPMFFDNEKQMYGAIIRLLRDPQADLTKNAQDYQIYAVGEFDTDTGVIDPIPPQFLFNVVDLSE